MASSLPSAASKANCNSTTDNPQQALLVDLADLVDKFNEMRTALEAVALMEVGEGLAYRDNGSGVADTLISNIEYYERTGDITSPIVHLNHSRLQYYTPATADNRTFTLGAASTYGADWYCFFQNGSSYVITIDADGSELINGTATIALQPGDGGILVCSGSGWAFIGLTQKKISLRKLIDVEDTAAANGEVLVWSSTNSRWEPTALSSALNMDGSGNSGANQVMTTAYTSYHTDTIVVAAGSKVFALGIVDWYNDAAESVGTPPQIRIYDVENATSVNNTTSESDGYVLTYRKVEQLVCAGISNTLTAGTKTFRIDIKGVSASGMYATRGSLYLLELPS